MPVQTSTGKKCQGQSDELDEDLVDAFGEIKSDSDRLNRIKSEKIPAPVTIKPVIGATAATPTSMLEAFEARWEEWMSKCKKLVIQSAAGNNKQVTKDDLDTYSESLTDDNNIKLFPS